MTTRFNVTGFPATPSQRGHSAGGAVGLGPRFTLFPAINYVERLTAFFVPPYNANYTFYITSDDASDLFLSTDFSEANARLVAQETSFNTLDNSFWRDPSIQRSAPIPLLAGRKYWFRIRHIQGIGPGFVRAAVRVAAAHVPAAGV
jgi:hypothetical protein